MKFKRPALVLWLSILGCSKPEVRHDLKDLNLKPGTIASLDLFGRVVTGKRNQRTHFQTGVLPIPIVKSGNRFVSLDTIRAQSFSEHSGRASGKYLHAKSINIVSEKRDALRFEKFSLTNMDRIRRLRTAIAQFPTRVDFELTGYKAVLFSDKNISNEMKTAIHLRHHPTASEYIKPLESALGRPLAFPVLIDANFLIENYE